MYQVLTRRRAISWGLICVMLIGFGILGEAAESHSGFSQNPESISLLDTMVFTASDNTKIGQLNQLLHLYLDETANPSGATFLNTGGNMSWLSLKAMALTPLGAVDGQGVLNSIKFSLTTTRLGPDGYVYGWFNGPFWPFPNYTHSRGESEGWEFDGTTKEGWTIAASIPDSDPSGGSWTLTLPNPDPYLFSPPLSVDSNQAPFVQVHMRCLDNGVDCETDAFLQVYWTTDSNPTFHETRSMIIEPLVGSEIPASQDYVTYIVPVFEHPDWDGTITQLRFDPVHNGQTGRSVDIDRIVLAYDARYSTWNAIFILALAEYYFSTGDSTVFTSNSTPEGTLFDRARIAMNFIQAEMGGQANDFVNLDWVGHDGLPGKVGGSINVGHGIPGNISDVWPIGKEDTYATVYYLAALEAIADLETEADNNPAWGVPANPFGETPSSLLAQADDVRNSLATVFWDSTAGRLIACRDVNGVAHDIGHVGLNLEAIFFEALDSQDSSSVVHWISGTRLVPSDTSQGDDIYHWEFGPRTNTVEITDWYIWTMYMWFGIDLDQGSGARWGEQVQNGGGWFWHSFYDLVARQRVLGANNSWDRFSEILDWFQLTQDAGGFRAYYASHDGNLQGCGTGGNIGLDCEFIENTLVPLAFLHGPLGYRVDIDGLHLGPILPTALSHAGVNRLHFRQHFYDISAESASGTIEICTHPETSIPGFENSPHALPLVFSNLTSDTDFAIQVFDVATGETQTTSANSGPGGTIPFVAAMPQDGCTRVKSARIFEDGFEQGNTDYWSVSCPPDCDS